MKRVETIVTRDEARESMADFARETAQDYTLGEFAAQGRALISHVVLRIISFRIRCARSCMGM